MYQSSMYQLTQSLGAVSMVNIEQIKKQQNLDYLEHLCTFIQKMNMNPIWYQNQDVNSKLKILQLYQLAINYSKNMETDCTIAINNQTERINSLSDEERQKTEYIRNMKEQYSQAKQEYKLKKHTLVRKVHTNLKRKLQRMHQNQQYQRQQRQQRTYRSGQETPREIIYYVPNTPPVNQIPPGYPPPYDPYNPSYHRDMQYPGYYHPQQPQQHYYPPTQSNNLTPNGGNTMTMPQYEQQIGPFQTNLPNNDGRSPSQNQSLKKSNNQQIQAKKLVDSKKSIKQNKEQLGLPANSNRPMTSTQLVRDQFQSYGSGDEELDLLQKSNIIAKHDEVLVRMSKQPKKQAQPNLQPPSNPKHSVKKSSSFEDDIGDLTANSKKREGSNNNIDEELAQYDSIANININRNDANSRISPKTRFQSKIQNKNQASTPKTANLNLQTINEQNNDNILDGFPSGLMNSKFSKNSKKGENQPQKLYVNSNIPRKNSTKINGTVFKGYEEIKDISQQPQKIGNEPSKLFKNEKPKRQNKPQSQPLNDSKSRSENPVNILDNIFESNVGSKKVNPPELPKQNYNSMRSNMGLIKQQNQDNKAEQLYSIQKPKRRSHIQTSSLQPPSANNLKVSFAQSQNGGMIESKAYSIKFSKPNQTNTPPQLQKQKQEHYDDDFEDELNEKSVDVKQKPVILDSLDDDGFGDIDLEHSRIPVSKKISKQEKSQVEINLASHQTIIDIKRQKYAGLPNDTFIPKNQQSESIIPITSIKNNLDISDNLFDEIMQIPMNSVIARRPSTINKLSRVSKDVKSLQHLDSLHSSNNLTDNAIASPSIHIIDPAGRNQTIMNRKGANLQKIQQEPQISYKQSPRDEAGLRKSGLPNFDAMADSSVFVGQKKTSILELNYIPNQKQKSEKEERKIEDDDSFDINLSEKSNIQKKQSKKSQPQKNIAQIRAKLQKIQKQAAKPKNPSIFDKSIIQKAIKTQAKNEINFINTQKWGQLEKYYLLQNKKITEELQKKKKKKQGAKKQQVTPRQSKTESYYAQKLEYSKSLAKVQNRSGGNFTKNELQVGPIREMTESITINQPKVQQRSSPKSIDNKFAARLNSNKSKNQIQNIKKNLSKNPYQRDDELQNVIKQNKSKLLHNSQLSEDDF